MNMKKIILFSFLIFSAAFSIAQTVEITLDGQTDVLNGTTVNKTFTNGNDSKLDFKLKNISGVEKYWKMTRLRIDTPPANWTDYICLGLEGDPFGGSCYNHYATNPWSTPAPVQHTDPNTGNVVSGLLNTESALAAIHWAPGDSNYGTATYRYYVGEDGGPYEDSVDVLVSYTSLGIKESKAVELSVYPNPVANQLSIVTEGIEKFDVRITDVFGKLVYDESANKTKKVDVSDFKNGVYIVTILEKGSAIKTRRIVVKH